MKLSAHIGTAVKAHRSTAGLTREQLAITSGVSPRTLSRIEAGEDCLITTLDNIAGALNVRITDLLPEATS